MLAVPNMYPSLAPMQAVGLIPILYFAVDGKVKKSVMCAAGMYMGLACTLPQILYLRLPVVITVILIIHLAVVMVLLVMGWRLLAGRPAVWAGFAAGAYLVVIDWYNFTVLPMWGTSQSLVRCWSRYPPVIQFTSLTGITAIAFVLGVLQAFVAYMISRPGSRRRIAAAAAAVVVIVIAANVVCRLPEGGDRLTVAATIHPTARMSTPVADLKNSLPDRLPVPHRGGRGLSYRARWVSISTGTHAPNGWRDSRLCAGNTISFWWWDALTQATMKTGCCFSTPQARSSGDTQRLT